MKTIKGIQITNLKSTAVAILLLIIAGTTAVAKELPEASLKIQDEMTSLAMSEEIMENTNSGVSNDLFAYDMYLVTEREEALEIENWMNNESLFNSFALIEEATEEALEMENWMTNGNLFYSNSYLEVENEKPLELENWMLDSKLYEDADEKIEKEENTEETKKVRKAKKEEKQKRSKSAGTTYKGKNYGTRAFFLMEVEDKELKMERWMVDYHIWSVK